MINSNVRHTRLLRIFCTGSESSKTTNPKLGSLPPLLILNSNTVPYSEIRQTIKSPHQETQKLMRHHTQTLPSQQEHKLTFKELFQLSPVHIMWHVSYEELLAVGIPDHPPHLRLSALSFPHYKHNCSLRDEAMIYIVLTLLHIKLLLADLCFAL